MRLTLHTRVFLPAVLALLSLAAQAATITVTSNLDTHNDGVVTLREAIAAINAGNDLGDPDITAQGPFTGANAFGTNDAIHFSITGGGLQTITPASPYTVTKTVVIDGYTQSGASANTNAVGQGLNTVLTIQLAGANAILETSGAASAGSVFRGMVFNGAVFLSNNNKVEGSFIGTNATGTASTGLCGTGVEFGSATNTVGGTTAAARNLISGCINVGVGIVLNASADGNVIQGNLIGTDKTGTAALANNFGIVSTNAGTASGWTIGGAVAGAGNVISGNNNDGIQLGAPGTGAVIQGNRIGTDVTGTVALGNGIGGVRIFFQQTGATIGGTAAAAGNQISGNGQFGLYALSGNAILGNRIGTNAAGTAALGSQTLGIFLIGNNNQVGGAVAGAANIIAFNNTGIQPAGILVNASTTGNTFLTNSIHDNGTSGGIVFSFPPPNPSTAPPTLTSASISSGSVDISGQVNATFAPNTEFRLEFFSNVVCDTSGNGEGKTFLGSQVVTSNAGGTIGNFGPFNFAVPAGETVFTATLTSNSNTVFGAAVHGGGVRVKGTGPVAETSKFSACLSGLQPPVITKNFLSPTIQAGALGQVGLHFTIHNPNPQDPLGLDPTFNHLTGVGFTDTLPGGLIIFTPNGLVASCGGVTATAGSNQITMANGTVGAGLTCTIDVTINAPAGTPPGLLHNVTSAVTSNEGGAGNTASSDITVQAVQSTPPLFSKQFGTQSIALNGTTTLTFTITNTNQTSLTGVSFSDPLPAGLVVASTPGLTSTCGGVATAIAGSSNVSLTGGTLTSGQQCQVAVNVTGTAAGTKNNVSGTVSATESGAGGTASASLAVVAPPVISKAFGTQTIAVNGTTTLTVTITNPAANTVALSGVAFTDNLPAGLTVAATPGVTNTCGGTVTAAAGSTSVALSGGSVAVGGSCSVTANVTGATAGAKDNTISGASSTNGGTAATSNTATVTVSNTLTIAKSFGAVTIPLNGSTSLNFTITNPNAGVTVTGVAFTDTLPAGLVVATPASLNGTCGGTITATAGASSVSLSGATLAGGASCTVSVTVTGTSAGVKNNSVTVSSTQTGTSSPSNANLTVIAPPTIGKQFGAGSVLVNGSTTLTFNIANPNATSAMSGIGMTDTLPAGLVVSTPNGLTGSCGGGTITAVAGSGSITLTGASLASASSCSFSVNVTATAAGQLVNNTGAVTSVEGGTGGSATATLQVNGSAPRPATNIPTLQRWMLALLGLLLAATALLKARRPQRGIR